MSYANEVSDHLEHGIMILDEEDRMIAMNQSPGDPGAGGVIARLGKSGDPAKDARLIRQARHDDERARALFLSWNRHRRSCPSCPSDRCAEGVRLYKTWRTAEEKSYRFKKGDQDERQ